VLLFSLGIISFHLFFVFFKELSLYSAAIYLNNSPANKREVELCGGEGTKEAP